MSEAAERQRLYDRSRPEYTQAKGHNQRVKKEYPEIWAASILTNESLAEWMVSQKGIPCPYCGDPTKEIDHKLPLSKGGEHSIENLEMLCLDCNRSKHDMTDEEFRKYREIEPKRKKGTTLADYGIDYKELKDKGKRFRTRSLFKEMWKSNPNLDKPPIFILKADDDVDGLISVKRVYLEIGDPTEYKIAVALFKDPRHWAHLCKQGWFMEHLSKWRAELKAKIRSLAVDALIRLSEENLQAIKTLATEDYFYTPFTELDKLPAKRRVGRPNKEGDPTGPTEEEMAADAARINLN